MWGTLVDLRILVKLTGASCFELDDGRAAGGVVEDEEQEDGATIPAGRCAVIRRLCRVRFGAEHNSGVVASASPSRCLRVVPHTASGRACGSGTRHSCRHSALRLAVPCAVQCALMLRADAFLFIIARSKDEGRDFSL